MRRDDVSRRERLKINEKSKNGQRLRKLRRIVGNMSGGSAGTNFMNFDAGKDSPKFTERTRNLDSKIEREFTWTNDLLRRERRRSYGTNMAGGRGGFTRKKIAEFPFRSVKNAEPDCSRSSRARALFRINGRCVRAAIISVITSLPLTLFLFLAPRFKNRDSRDTDTVMDGHVFSREWRLNKGFRTVPVKRLRTRSVGCGGIVEEERIAEEYPCANP